MRGFWILHGRHDEALYVWCEGLTSMHSPIWLHLDGLFVVTIKDHLVNLRANL